MSVSRASERAIAGRRTDQRSEDSSDEERWRSPCAGRTHGTAWLVDSACELGQSKPNRSTARRPRQVVQAAGEDGVDDLHHNRHDVNEVGRLGAQSHLVNA